VADVSLPALRRSGVARVIGELIGQWRGRSNSARTIDPDALSDHMQRDLGFRDGRSRPTPFERPGADLPAWR
jgi:hypothetical protein